MAIHNAPLCYTEGFFPNGRIETKYFVLRCCQPGHEGEHWQPLLDIDDGGKGNHCTVHKSHDMSECKTCTVGQFDEAKTRELLGIKPVTK
jgi:hypothetical protein